MAPVSLASADITEKMVVPRMGCLERIFMLTVNRNAIQFANFIIRKVNSFWLKFLIWINRLVRQIGLVNN